ncbi:MAG TPA: TonB family protein [Roseiarcus sp.]|nr:TonB family protein [Roseiarcus sp.]
MSTATSLSDADFGADALDHKLATPEPASADRRALLIALMAAGALHLVLAVGLVLLYVFAPRPAPPMEEIPVEVVVEPPPPPPKPEPQKEQPKPPPTPEDERPAYDAPSAATEEKANRESPDDKTQSPARAEPSRELGAPQESERPAARQEQKAEASPPPEQAKPMPDAERPAAETPTPADGEAPPAAAQDEDKPSPPRAPKPRAPAPTGAPLPAAEVLPQYQFAHAATESPVVGGNADTRYFTIVFGMIKQHLREPSGPRPSRGGAVIFTVDEGGNLVERHLAASSGSPSLDLAVMNAIAQAAPYPPPPNWQPRSMKLVYGK